MKLLRIIKLLRIMLLDLCKVVCGVVFLTWLAAGLFVAFVQTILFWKGQPYEITHGFGYLAIIKGIILGILSAGAVSILSFSGYLWVRSCLLKSSK
jgi:hypothetical protein